MAEALEPLALQGETRMKTADDVVRGWGWMNYYVEPSGRGRGNILRLADENPWILDTHEHLSAEEFPMIGDVTLRIQIGNFTDFGRGVVLNGLTQNAEGADRIYTPSLVYPAALTARSRKRWFVAGGGDGATLREALRFRDTERVLCAEISRAMVSQTQLLIPSLWGGCQSDSRLEIRYQDALVAAHEAAKRREFFDIILLDLADETDDDYTRGMVMTADGAVSDSGLATFARCLAIDGIIVVQTGECSEHKVNGPREVARRLQRMFRHVRVYARYVSFFGYMQSFVIATNCNTWAPSLYAGTVRHAQEALVELYDGMYLDSWLPYYDESVHHAMFDLPPAVRRRLESGR